MALNKLLTGQGTATSQIFVPDAPAAVPFTGIPFFDNGVLLLSAFSVDVVGGLTIAIDGIDPTQVDISVGTGFGITVGANTVAVNTAANFTGANAWTGSHEFNGPAVTFGNAATDLVTFNSRIATDLPFLKEVNHTISVDASTTAVTAGANLTISPAVGAPLAAGGLLSLLGAAGGAGNGGTAAGNGSSITIRAGNPGANGGGGVGTGGTVTIDAGVSVGATQTNNGTVDIGANATSLLLGNASATLNGIELRTYLHNTASSNTNPLSLSADGNATIRVANVGGGNAGIEISSAPGGGGGRTYSILASGSGAAWGAGYFTIYDGGFGDLRLTINSTGRCEIYGRNDAFNAAKDGGRFISWGLEVNAAALTSVPAGVEFPDVYFNLARTMQFNTGAIATQRAVKINAPTYAFVAASTITTAATLAVSGAPVAGTNATLTNTYSFWVEAGLSRLAGNVLIDGSIGFFSTTPVAQYATTGTVAGFTAATATPVLDGSTFTGNTGATAYTIGDVVRCLKLYGLMAL